MASGLCDQRIHSLGLTGLGTRLPVSHAASCVVTTIPSRTVRNPLKKALIVSRNVRKYIDRSKVMSETENTSCPGSVAHNILIKLQRSHFLPIVSDDVCVEYVSGKTGPHLRQDA